MSRAPCRLTCRLWCTSTRPRPARRGPECGDLGCTRLDIPDLHRAFCQDAANPAFSELRIETMRAGSPVSKELRHPTHRRSVVGTNQFANDRSSRHARPRYRLRVANRSADLASLRYGDIQPLGLLHELGSGVRRVDIHAQPTSAGRRPSPLHDDGLCRLRPKLPDGAVHR